VAKLTPEQKARVKELVAPAGPEIDTREAPEWFHRGQRRAWKSQAMEVVCVAGTQGGKTAIQAWHLLRQIQRAAPLIKKLRRGNFIYAGPTMTLMEAQAIPAFRELFEEDLQLGKLVLGTKPKFHFSREGVTKLFGAYIGSITVHFAYASSSSNLESLTAQGAVWDECGQPENKLSAYRAMNRRLKAARSTTFAMMLDTAREAGMQWWIDWFYNAEGPDALFGQRLWGTTPYEWGWFKSNIYDKAKARHPRFSLHRFSSWMNPLVSKQECREDLLLGMPLWEWLMMYMGLFTKPAGSIYGHAFDRKRNTCKRFPIPNHWPRYMGIDFGAVNMAAVFFAYDPENKRYIVYRTYHRGVAGIVIRKDPGSPSAENGHIDNWRLDERRDVNGNVIDPTAFGGSMSEDGWRQEFAEEGFSIIGPEVNDVELRINAVRTLLIQGKLVIFDDQNKLIAEIEGYSRVLDAEGNPTKDIKDKAKYHRVDGLGYGCLGLTGGISDAPVVINPRGKSNEQKQRERDESDELPTERERDGAGKSGRGDRDGQRVVHGSRDGISVRSSGSRSRFRS
jgi:hypothetical protein